MSSVYAISGALIPALESADISTPEAHPVSRSREESGTERSLKERVMR
jgi:hypothetical protein